MCVSNRYPKVCASPSVVDIVVRNGRDDVQLLHVVVTVKRSNKWSLYDSIEFIILFCACYSTAAVYFFLCFCLK